MSWSCISLKVSMYMYVYFSFYTHLYINGNNRFIVSASASLKCQLLNFCLPPSQSNLRLSASWTSLCLGWGRYLRKWFWYISNPTSPSVTLPDTIQQWPFPKLIVGSDDEDLRFSVGVGLFSKGKLLFFWERVLIHIFSLVNVAQEVLMVFLFLRRALSFFGAHVCWTKCLKGKVTRF